MSLTSQLHGGTLARWCVENFPGSVAAATHTTNAVNGVAPAPPPAGAALNGMHWAQVGEVFRARMAALVQDAPPYSSLYGLTVSGVVSVPAGHAIAAGYRSHRDLQPELERVAMDVRPTPTDWLLIAGPEPTTAAGAGWGDRVFAQLAARGRGLHAETAPTGSIGTPWVEASLARSYGAWTIGCDSHRAGNAPVALTALHDAVHEPRVEQLRSLTWQPVVNDVTALAGRLAGSGSLAELRAWAGDPDAGEDLGFSEPVLCPHWAEGDLLVGDTLIDVKVMLRTDDVHRVARWLWQLLGLAWIDESDRWRIRHLALYFARHGVLVRWDVDELAELLIGNPACVHDVRARFVRATRRTATAEGATWLSPG